jgi:predicted ArsR family transcriptional regulator
MHTRDNTRRALYLIKSRGPQTAAMIGEALGMSAVGARGHLRKLEQRGLVTCFDRAEQVGRPRQYWQLTELGQREFPDRHSDLNLALIDNVRELFGEDGLDTLIQRREQDTLRDYRSAMADCRDLPARVGKLAELRNAEGYMAEVEADGNGWLLLENHCPICAAARHCQGFCRAELELFRELLDAGVEREEHIIAGARRCAYRITPIT